MKRNWAIALAPLAMLALAGCGGPKAPTGQVVATVGDQEITQRDLQAEMQGVEAPTPEARKQAEMAAVQNMVSRKILAKAATDQKIDQTPEFALQKQRGVESLLVQSMQNKIVAQVPAVTREEATRFVAGHPDTFEKRRIFTLEQVKMARPSDPSLLKEFQPIKTLEGVTALLDAKKIPYEKGSGMLDTVGIDPRMTDAIIKLPPGEVFVVPQNNLLLVSVVRNTQIQPFTGEPAVNYAMQLLKRMHTQEAVQIKMGGLVKQGLAKVKYNKAYAPPAPLGKPTKAG